jgi:hypothetical protein
MQDNSVVHLYMVLSVISHCYPSGAPKFTPGFYGFHVARSLMLAVKCFVHFVCSFSRRHFLFTASDNHFDIFKDFSLPDRMVVGFTILMQSVPITTDVVSSNPAPSRYSRCKIM